MQSEVESSNRSNSFNFCPECPETNESKQSLLIHFICSHYVKYAEYRKRGLDVLRKNVPGFAGSQLEEILKPILNPQVEESPIVDLHALGEEQISIDGNVTMLLPKRILYRRWGRKLIVCQYSTDRRIINPRQRMTPDEQTIFNYYSYNSTASDESSPRGKYLSWFPGELNDILKMPLIPPGDLEIPKYDFGVDSNEMQKFYPSYSLIIEKTRSQVDQKRLDVWRQKQIELLGLEIFEKNMKDRMKTGSQLHSLCYEYLDNRKNDIQRQCANGLESSAMLNPYWTSAKSGLDKISSLKYYEMKLSHPFLCYKGVFDGIVTHNDQLVIFEIKTSDRIKNSLATSFDYPLQVAAYTGLINYDKSLDLKITNGLIMVCYPQEHQSATLLEVDFNNMQKYWRKWLKRLLQFWAYEDKNVLC